MDLPTLNRLPPRERADLIAKVVSGLYRRKLPTRSVRMGDRQFLGRILGDHLATLGGDHHLFLDARGRDAVLGRAVGLERENRARLDLDRLLEGIEARDDRPLVDAQPDAMRKFEPERLHLAREA